MIEGKSSSAISGLFNSAILIILSVLCIIPIVLIISISVSPMEAIYKWGYTLIPKALNFDAYSYILRDNTQIFTSYWVSIRVVVIGGFLSVLFTALIAYPLSKAEFRYKNHLTFLVFFTMLFNGGMVPWYILIVNYLHLKNTLWVLILPHLINAWYVMMMRTFFKSLPSEIMEAAEVDGCSEYRIFFTIVMPMSKPAVATISLLSVLSYWNDWFLALLFIEKDKLVPLQFLLYRLISNLEEIKRQIMEGGLTNGLEEFPTEPARMAMAIIAAGPMLFVFPFFQRYFVKGLTVGAVKG